jgi:hypothetical protein
MAAPGAHRSHAAEEVMGMSGQDQLEESSKALGVEDFELVKTLGTGKLCVHLQVLLSGLAQQMTGKSSGNG